MQRGRGSGGKCTDSSESSDRVGLLLRMSLLSELEVLTGFLLHWEPWDTKSNLGGYQLKVLEPATNGKESGLWPTCRASDAEHGGPNQKDSKGNPALPAAVHYWPTPTATEYGSNQGGANGRTGPTRPSISRLVQDSNNTIGKNRERLNPKWVLQLMGYPANWLSVPSAMPSSPRFHTQLQGQYKESKELSRRNRFS